MNGDRRGTPDPDAGPRDPAADDPADDRGTTPTAAAGREAAGAGGDAPTPWSRPGMPPAGDPSDRAEEAEEAAPARRDPPPFPPPDPRPPHPLAPDPPAAPVLPPMPGGGTTVRYRLTVDGQTADVTADLGASLFAVLRDQVGVAAVKGACEQGRCGSCTVLLAGTPVASCTVLAATTADGTVTTVAGLRGRAADVQEAFLDEGAVQCGYCTPGFVVAVTDLLGRRPDAGEAEVREALAGNVCRCTGYGRILAAVRAVQEARR